MFHTFFTSAVAATTALAIGIGSYGGGVYEPADPNAVSVSQNLRTVTTESTDEVDNLIRALESIPEDLKTADPRTPGYEAKLNTALGGLVVGGSYATTTTGWWKCTVEVAKVIVTYGVPVFKVVQWLKRAKQLWGGIRGIIYAIRSGQAAAEIGADGASILEGILGLGGVKKACFG